MLGVSVFFSLSIISTEISSSSTSEGRSIRYNIRNCEVGGEDSGAKGLSVISCGISSMRIHARKSYFSWAQSHALLDVASGKHYSIN